MSILDGLRKDIASGNWVTSDLRSALAYNQALHEVREALRSDEQVKAIAGRLDLVSLTWEKVTVEVQDDSSTPPYLTTTMRQRPVEAIVRDVLAAAGGDQ